MILEFDEIVSLNAVGQFNNPIDFNSLYSKAEHIKPSSTDTDTVLLLGIDLQYDFMDEGSLGVTGAIEDMKRLLQWFYQNLEKITAISLSKDTHNIYQVFFPAWWISPDGRQPAPLTAITLADLDNNKWLPVVNPVGSRDYVENLEKQGKKTLVIWPYHCIQGTIGAAIDNQLMNLAMYHSLVRRTRLNIIVKGTDPMSEMYGIFKPEYSPTASINVKVLDAIAKFDKIVITGQAKSHCVLESIAQMLEHYQNDPETMGKIYIIEDTMSVIQSFEDATEEAFDDFRRRGVNLVSTQDFNL